jgi:hypothetical protein
MLLFAQVGWPPNPSGWLAFPVAFDVSRFAHRKRRRGPLRSGQVGRREIDIRVSGPLPLVQSSASIGATIPTSWRRVSVRAGRARSCPPGSAAHARRAVVDRARSYGRACYRRGRPIGHHVHAHRRHEGIVKSLRGRIGVTGWRAVVLLRRCRGAIARQRWSVMATWCRWAWAWPWGETGRQETDK